MYRKSSLIASVSCMAVAFSAVSASASLVYETGFEGAEGYATEALSAHADWSADNNFQVVDGGLDHYLSGDEQHLQFTGVAGSQRAFTNLFDAQTGTFYLGFTFQLEGELPIGHFGMIHFGTSDGDSPRIGLRLHEFNFKARSGGEDNPVGSAPLVAGEVYRVVAKVSKDGSSNYNRIDFWFDPPTDEEPAVNPAQSVVGDTGTETLSHLRLRFQDTQGAVLNFDNVMIGDSFESVVPEPASLALLGAGGLLLVMRRRGGACRC